MYGKRMRKYGGLASFGDTGDVEGWLGVGEG